LAKFLLYYDDKLDDFFTDVAKYYNVKKSALIEEMIISFLDPGRFLLVLTLIKNDEFYEDRLKVLLERDR